MLGHVVAADCMRQRCVELRLRGSQHALAAGIVGRQRLRDAPPAPGARQVQTIEVTDARIAAIAHTDGREERSRLDVSLALHDKRFGDDGRPVPRRRAMRKERRDGRIVFLLLVIALFIAVIWLIAHFRTF